MIKVYYLRQLKDEASNTEYTEGTEFISHAISEATEKPDIRRVIIEENANLAGLALKVEEPSQRDIDNYNSLPEPSPLPRDLLAEFDAAKVKIADLEKATGIGGAGQKGIAQRIDNLEARIAALGG